jgi:SAM-dependent methyltransferase
MRRKLLRLVPGLGRVARALDEYEATIVQLRAENARLASYNAHHATLAESLRHRLHQLAFENDGGDGEQGGLPLPPPVLRFLVAGTDDLDGFLRLGTAVAGQVREYIDRGKLGGFGRVLDFGCGCGRVLRHLVGVPAELHGCDPNPHAVHWCRSHLPFARFEVNRLAPPLPYPDAHFGLVYAFSVITHLTPHLQAAWMGEMRRVIAPGGHLLLTTHGEAHVPDLNPTELAEYRAGRPVVRATTLEGGNDCAAFHPPEYVRGVLAAGWTVAEFIQGSARGNPPQDAYLLRRDD